MSKTARPKPPASLGRAGASLWRAILSDLDDGWELDARELQLLTRACSAEDHLVALEAAVKKDGATVPGSMGQVGVHPAIAEARQQKLAQLRLLGALEMTEPSAGARSATPRQAQARRAAEVRWGEHRERTARRG
jgi:phage terminase small subunit